MTTNIALRFEQQQRYDNDLAARDAEIENQTDLYALGHFDGVIGAQPTDIEQSYWEGYQIGYRQYWATKLGISLPTEF